MSKGSFFKGWASTQPNIPQQLAENKSRSLYVGHVLRVNYRDGEIKVRLIGVSRQEKDEDIEVKALPANLNMVKYPLPGEIVLMCYGLQNLVAKEKYATCLYYFHTITSNSSVTYNSDPYIGQTMSNEQVERLQTEEYDTRFEDRLKDPKAFIDEQDGNKIIPERGLLKPIEGDVVLQSRFGSRVRLSSTSYDASGVGSEWSEDGGIYGDPLIAITSDRRKYVGARENNQPIIDQESVNETESTIYLCSSQTVGIELPTSKLLSFKQKYDIPLMDGELSVDAVDPISFVSSPAEIAKPWVKVDTGDGGGGNSGGSGVTIPVVDSKQEGVTNTRYNLAGNLIVSIPKIIEVSYPLFVVFGGINYANSKWMYDQMNGPMLSKYVVVCANYTDRFSKIRPVYEAFLKKQNVLTTTLSIAGFSAGGLPAFEAYVPGLAIFGAIDPSTREKFLSLSFSKNAIMVYNPSNWLGQGAALETISKQQPQIGALIQKAGGKQENIKMSHAKIPTYFFNKYCV